MDEALVQAVTDRIWASWNQRRPQALLLGREPREDLGYRYVTEGSFDAVVIGSLTPGQLLFFRDDRVLAFRCTCTPRACPPAKTGRSRPDSVRPSGS